MVGLVVFMLVCWAPFEVATSGLVRCLPIPCLLVIVCCSWWIPYLGFRSIPSVLVFFKLNGHVVPTFDKLVGIYL